jgi:hypothetical protein
MSSIKILLILSFGLLIFSCMRRKKAPARIGDWLELHFPNRFEVLETHTADPIRNLSFKVKKSVVAEKTDTMIQFQVKWDTREAGLGLNVAEINEQALSAKQMTTDARSLLEAAQKSGYSNLSVGIQRGKAYLFVFEEPNSENRKKAAKRINTFIANWPLAKQYQLKICLMEPAAYHAEFTDIVPLKVWARQDNWLVKKTVLDLTINEGKAPSETKLTTSWQFNNLSDRQLQIMEKATGMAEKWAKEHLKKPVFFSSMSEYESLDKILGLQFKFPFSYQENGDIAGSIKVDYLLDTDRYENLKVSSK